MNARRRGFSLIELLLVLFVLALITMSYFALQQRNMEVDKAQDLGYRLFEYGQALGDYIRTEGKKYPATGPGVEVYDGYQWLVDKGYLSKDFSLVVEPLYIEPIPATSPDQPSPEEQMRTSIFVKESATYPGEYELALDVITIGPVYARSDVTYDEEGVSTVTQDLSLISRAVNYANEYRDNIKGSGLILYSRVEAPNGDNTVSIIEGRTVDQNLWNDAWLLRSGANTMQGPIKFQTSEPNDSKIEELSNIRFAQSGWGAINDVQVINFTGAATLSMPLSINFADNGAISNIQALNFASSGTIQGIASIEFLDTATDKRSVFTGIRNITVTAMYKGDRTQDLGIPIANHFCALSRTHVPENGGGCEIYRGTSTYPNTYVIDVQKGKNANDGNGVECKATCFEF